MEADVALHRMGDSGDTEALHDLRVALRRLSSLFIIFAPALTQADDLAGQLRQLQRETNTARDLEIFLFLQQQQQLELPWLEQQWHKQLESEYKRLRHSLPSTWKTLATALDCPHDLLEKKGAAQPLGDLAARMLDKEQHKLHQRRNALCQEWTDKGAHKLRITGKHIRYILEPFATPGNVLDTCIEEMKRFQDLLGDYHDLFMLNEALRAQQPTENQRWQLADADEIVHREKHLLHERFVEEYCGLIGNSMEESIETARKTLAQT